MADVSVKMGVSGVSQFKQGMQQAQQSVKTMDAALKKNEAQLKATGNAELYMATKSDLLKQKLGSQKKEVEQANKALQVMVKNGVDPASKEYQKMAQSLLNAEAAMLDTETQIRELGNASADAAGKTDKLESSLGGLNRKVSLEQVNSAIKSMTTGIENAAKKAVQLGKQLWNNIMEIAEYSDDANTQAAILGMDVEDYQRYKGVFDTVADITVAEWMKAKTKIRSAIYRPTDDQTDILDALGIKTHEGAWGKEGWVQGAARDVEDVLWDVGQALQRDVASGKIDQGQADTWAQALFGKGWAELNPLFNLGREAFYEKWNEIKPASREAIENSADLNDKIIELENTFQSLKVEMLGGIAPALTKVADAINGVLKSLLEYLQTPEGQQKLEELGKAIESIFGDLEDFDPAKAVDSFASVLTGVVDGIKWISDNWEGVVTGIKAICAAWAVGKIADFATNIWKAVDGAKTLIGLNGGGGTPATPTATGGGSGTSVGANAKAKVAALGSAGKSALSGAFGAGSSFSMAGGLSVAGPMAIMAALGYAGAKMVEANLNDENLNAIYGTTGETGDSIIETMSESAAEAAREYWKVYQDTGSEEAMDARDKLFEILSGEYENAELGVEFIEQIFDNAINGNDLDETVKKLGERLFGEDGMEVSLTIPEDEQAKLQEQASGMSPVQIPAVYSPSGINYGSDPRFSDSGGGGGSHGFANGLPYVPFDGYRAILHKGERVVTAREAGSSRNYSSNLYVESMYMNNGTDAEALAASMAAAQRRTMSGYGS